MCGIAGLFDLEASAPVERELLRAMTDAVTHRGPDESGLHVADGVGLGHRRLSIIDLATGQQPMANDDASCWLTYNGEIYNFAELRTELEGAGFAFRTHSDTEVLLRSWEHWGEDCVTRLRGMFAFAVWDASRQSLFLARDRLGIKPLYYALLPRGRIAFGSEMKSLMLIPELERRIDSQAVEDYFAYGYVPEPRSIYQSVRKLEPGHSLLLTRGQALPAPRKYWDLSIEGSLSISEVDAQTELVARIREAVDIRLVAEVPLGAFLSGGVDSSAVVAMMAELQDSPVNTCSIGFDVSSFDESAYASQVAERYRTNHNRRQVNPDDFSLVDNLIGLYDEPYADSSALPTYRVCELARDRVTVALSGDGGDENLAGYRRYRLHMAEERVRGLLPYGLRKAVFGPLGELYPKADWAPRMFRAKTTFQSLARDTVGAYFHSVSIFSDELRARLFSERLRADLQDYSALEVLRRHARGREHYDPLSLIQYLDVKTYLPGDILTKVDRASMAHALEVRVPLLDHQLVEWIGTLPPAFKLRGGEGKYIFKKSMESRLPNDILYRPKMGFGVPLAKWFRGPLRDRIEQAIMGERLRDCGYFDPAFLSHLLTAHASGRRDYSALLWTVMMFDAFLARSGHAGS